MLAPIDSTARASCSAVREVVPSSSMTVVNWASPAWAGCWRLAPALMTIEPATVGKSRRGKTQSGIPRRQRDDFGQSVGETATRPGLASGAARSSGAPISRLLSAEDRQTDAGPLVEIATARQR